MPSTGQSPLCVAAAHGHQEAVLILLLAGAEISVTDHTGNTALDLAYSNAHQYVLNLLLTLQFAKMSLDGDEYECGHKA